jgi:hypothetical protein
MSNKLEFINFCISFHDRLGQIIEKWRNPKTSEMLSEEEENIVKVLHRPHYKGELSFGNENRNPGEVIAGEQKL